MGCLGSLVRLVLSHPAPDLVKKLVPALARNKFECLFEKLLVTGSWAIFGLVSMMPAKRIGLFLPANEEEKDWEKLFFKLVISLTKVEAKLRPVRLIASALINFTTVWLVANLLVTY